MQPWICPRIAAPDREHTRSLTGAGHGKAGATTESIAKLTCRFQRFSQRGHGSQGFAAHWLLMLADFDGESAIPGSVQLLRYRPRTRSKGELHS